MTREELKQEAIKYAVDYPSSYGKGYKHKDLRIAYLAGAEPREKRIEELETENNKLLDVINNQDVKIADLEKENKKYKQQKNKVKFIVKDLLLVLDGRGGEDFRKEVLQSAEQFLKEIEK